MLDPNPYLYYTEVNVNNKAYKDFVERVMGMNPEEVNKSPSVLIIEEGVGDLIHGPEAVQWVANKVKAYKKQANIP